MKTSKSEEQKREEYRFDDAYESVYEYTNKAYVFIGSYLAFGINAKMSEKQKIAKVEAEINQ